MKSVYSLDPLLSCCVSSVNFICSDVSGGSKQKVNSGENLGCPRNADVCSIVATGTEELDLELLILPRLGLGGEKERIWPR